MWERLDKIRQIKFLPVLILAVIIVLQIANITNVIVNKKKGYHSDEIYSYGLSNSFYQPFISSDYFSQTEYKNVDEWISGQMLRDYVTVQPGETFRYDSVWYNQANDRHPPLYYAVLHTICSFFPNTYSPVFGYIINYICFIVMQIFLYKLALNMLKSKYLALLLCCFWGFSTGATDLTIFIRMYCMLAMMTVIFMYLHSEMYRISRQSGQKPPLKMYIALMVITTLGALTQYMFLIVAFFTAVFFCVYYLVKRQFKIFLKYGFSILGGTVLSVLIFPYTIPHLLWESSNQSVTSFSHQLYLAYKYFLRDIAVTITNGDIVFLSMTVPVFILIAVVFSLPILYLFRDKPGVKKFLFLLKTLPQKIKGLKLKTILTCLWNDIKKIHPLFYLFLICILAISIITAYDIDFYIGYANRYLFIVYPLAAVLLVCLLCFIFTRLKFKKTVVTIILSAVIFNAISGRSLTFLFDKTRTLDNVDELTSGNECIFVVGEKADTWLVDTLPGSVYNADNVIMTYVTVDEDILERIASLETNKKVYLFIDEYNRTDIDGTDCFLYYNEKSNHVEKISADDYYDIFRNLPYSTMFKYIGKYSIFTSTYTIYELA